MRPHLRAVELIRVATQGNGLVTVLRDSEGIAPGAVEVHPPLDAALELMNVRRSIADIFRALASAGIDSTTTAIETLVLELDAAGVLEGKHAQERRRRLVEAFRASPVRPASFAGSAYHG